jgi:DNA ligase D-like protein (predicted ligase)
MSLFDEKNISPMLLFETQPFNDKNYIYELKFDGSRCIAYIDKDSTILKNKRQKILNDAFPELTKIHKASNKRCILDGEIVCMKNGKPDFYTLQARSLLVDPVKIHYQSIKNPATFVAYDILFVGNEDITSLPLLKRKTMLTNAINENSNITISRYIEEAGIEFFNLAKKEGLEGIVAKEKNSLYYIGKRSKVWQKIKVMQEEDVIICGYLDDEDGKMKDLILGKYNDNNELEYYGKIFMGISKHDEKYILDFAVKNQVKPLFEEINQPNITWIKPELIGVIKYMMKTKSGGLRQPVFKGIKLD